MSESIFSRLFHYREREKLSPRENYLTEMLAWMIDSLPQFGQDYVGFLCEKCKTNLITERNQLIVVSAQTQCSVTAGFIDMVIKTDKKLGFICEHKVDSPLSENQIQKYLDCHDEIDASLEFKTVLLTKNSEQHTQKANISITWYDVYEYFSDRINKEAYEAGEKIIIEQFLMYLTEVGMGMKESINPNGVTYYSAAMNVESSLNSIFNDIYDELSKNNIETEFPGIQDFLRKSKYKLNTPGKESGRIGIKFSETWCPGLFAGVQLNNNDHSLQKFDSPQLVVIVDCVNGMKSKYQGTGWFKSLKDMQSKEETETGFHIQTASDNPWRVLILHKPLTGVLKGTRYEEQKKDIKDEIVSGINLILKYYNGNM